MHSLKNLDQFQVSVFFLVVLVDNRWQFRFLIALKRSPLLEVPFKGKWRGIPAKAGAIQLIRPELGPRS